MIPPTSFPEQIKLFDRPKYDSAPVPFIRVGNRRALTDQQLAESPDLADFVGRFPQSFERDATACLWLFVELADDPTTH